MTGRIQNVREADYNGTHYRSTLEAKTAMALDSLGIPFEYESRKIVLQEGFRCSFQKDKVRSIVYIPDFVIGPLLLECKGFETPEWKIKKKLVFKWLQENEPDTIFYQVKNAKKQLLEVLDRHLTYLGYYVEVTSKGTKKKPSETKKFSSIAEAMTELGLQRKPVGSIMNSLVGKKDFVFGYNWKLQTIKDLI